MALLTAPSTNKKLTEHRVKIITLILIHVRIFGDFRRFSIVIFIYLQWSTGLEEKKVKYCPIFLLSKNVDHLRPELESFPWGYYLTSNLFPMETGLD